MTQHADFASPATAPVYDPWAGTLARNAGAPASAPADAAPAVDNSVAPPSLALHARQVAVQPADAPLPGASAPVDRAFHPFSLPVRAVEPAPSVALPGIGLDVAHGAAQIATVANSRTCLDRARTYAARLSARLSEIRAKLATASERQVCAAIGTAAPPPVDLGPVRGEAIEVERLHRQALAVLAEVEAEHARHEGDAAALFGSDGAARAKLADAHRARALAQAAADAAKALHDRAMAHAGTVRNRLDAARAVEARHDDDATARLRAALADGDVLPAVAEPLTRISPALEDDLRAATAAVDALAAEHAGKIAALAAADLAVNGAVDGVLCAEAEAIARELQAADARALALRIRLHSYTDRRAADWTRPAAGPAKRNPGGWLEPDPAAYALPPAIRTTAVIGQAIASGPVPQGTGPFSGAWRAAADEWSAYAAALAADSQAEPGFADAPAAPTPSLPAPRAA